MNESYLLTQASTDLHDNGARTVYIYIIIVALSYKYSVKQKKLKYGTLSINNQNMSFEQLAHGRAVGIWR